jgi:sugar phosphate isomerase/epimerase
LSGLSLSTNFNQPDPAKIDAEIEQTTRWLDVGKAVQAPVMRVFGGSCKQRDDPAELDTARRRVLEALKRLTPEAERRGMVLALENHGGMPCTGEEQVAMIQAVNSPALRATIDVGNYMSGGQEGHVGARLAAAYAAYVHFKDFKKIDDPAKPWGWGVKATVVGEGDVDCGACLKALKEAGYNGFVALEFEDKDTDEMIGVPKSIRYMNEVMRGY